MKRAIVLFPSFDNISKIQMIREKYDPLANYIGPHFTIVFPFDSDLTTEELRAHCSKALQGIKKFPVVLKEITGDYRDGYLFLNVKKGNDNIIELHDKLYRGILEPHLVRKVTYCPHVTAGRLPQESDFNKALNELSDYDEVFESIIDTIHIVNIDSSEHSIIEFSLELE